MMRLEHTCKNEGAQAPTFFYYSFTNFHARARSALPRRGEGICGSRRVDFKGVVRSNYAKRAHKVCVVFRGRAPTGAQDDEAGRLRPAEN